MRTIYTRNNVQYRIKWCSIAACQLEYRTLRPDGTPFDQRWYDVSDGHLDSIQRSEDDFVPLAVEESRRLNAAPRN